MNKFAKALLLTLVVVTTAVVSETTVQAKSSTHQSGTSKAMWTSHRHKYSSTHHAPKHTTRSSTTTGS